MTNCPRCKAVLADDEMVCPQCSTSVADSFTPTAMLGEETGSKSTEAPTDGARFAPGTMLTERYRIVSLIGRGGMGEVYKAEDLKLRQIVALKFMPEALAIDGGALARFHNEVRVTRQISHPNVCRVYDIGEVAGQHFLSMEYIDGEDLSRLLRRIGRLPGDKAIEITRQICAGLAAAHENGVLHRDLKPANIMIDGRGKARVADFGVAVVASELRGVEAVAGTPGYMAPEQMSGKEVTQRSDIYSLGLVLYELFTGKRAFDAKSLTDLMELTEKSVPSTPSTHIKDIDPLVEGVILRCLEKDPQKRPASAIQVAAALPGGDPLAAALAAGETPSPEMVAASGEKTGIRPVIAIGLMAAVVIGLVLHALISDKVNWKAQMVRETSPEAANGKAREIIKRLGYTNPPLDSASGMAATGESIVKWAMKEDKSANRWNRLTNIQPAPLYFWYRQSPGYLSAQFANSFGWVQEDDPPQNSVSGMVNLRLDPSGRMTYFRAVPPEIDAPGEKPPVIDWGAAFAAAGLDQTSFMPTESTWTPRQIFDTRAAWTGNYPDQKDISIRIEAASYRGKLVSFAIIPPWEKPLPVALNQLSTRDYLSIGFIISVLLTIIIGALLLARYNLKRGRGDRRGAIRLCLVVYAASMLGWLIGASHVPTPDGFFVFLFETIGQPFTLVALVGLTYLALEPIVRRRWPETIISWSRVLGGSFRDPVIGRDVLIGILCGIAVSLINDVAEIINRRMGAVPINRGGDFFAWLNVRQMIANGFLFNLDISLVSTLIVFFLVVLLLLLTRRKWVAALLFTAILSVSSLLNDNSSGMVEIVSILLSNALMGIVAVRLGLLPIVVYSYIYIFIGKMPISTDFSAWYAGNGLTAAVAVVALAGFAFHASLGGQKIFSGNLLEE